MEMDQLLGHDSPAQLPFCSSAPDSTGAEAGTWAALGKGHPQPPKVPDDS